MASRYSRLDPLEHLEELRVRILRTLLALVACFGAGLWLVNRFGLISLLKAPIAPFLPDGKLTVLSPTDPVMIVLKLAFVVGLVGLGLSVWLGFARTFSWLPRPKLDDAARTIYQQVIQQYPRSREAELARDRMANLRP